jgi:GTP cyclohydrolase I
MISHDMDSSFRQIIASLGENPEREGLQNTPERAARALKYLTSGYHEDIQSIINGALFESDMDEMVIIRDIELYSLCEHHMLPFFGKCHAAYIPNGTVLGLSKIARLVDHYARRLQIQETLTQQIAESLQEATQASGVGVIIQAHHLCMMMRGVQKQNSSMITSVMLGSLRKDGRSRSEFLSLAQK